MKCTRCKSVRIVNFIDGFGEKRIFCRSCWLSFPLSGFVKITGQKRLHEFEVEYNKPKIPRVGEF